MTRSFKLKVAQNIRLARLRAGYTQEELAQVLEKQQSSISQIELGSYAPNLYLAMQMAEALGCSIDELVYGEGGRDCGKEKLSKKEGLR